MKRGHCVQWMEGTISLVLADNLGSNGIGGFMESFSAQRPCRFCMGLLDEFQSKVIFVTFIIYVVTKAAVLMTSFNAFSIIKVGGYGKKVGAGTRNHFIIKYGISFAPYFYYYYFTLSNARLFHSIPDYFRSQWFNPLSHIAL
jgi:hypothetical protein